MDALAAEAFLNAEHHVYGLRMQPLSLGHAFALEAIGSSFYYGKQGEARDLQLAALICSRPPLAPIPETGLIHMLWRWWARSMDFDAQVLRWQVYVADYCAPPQMWNKRAKAGEPRPQPSRVPSQITTATRLMRLGIPRAEAWAMPVGEAAWYEVAFAEVEHGARLDIVTDSERLAMLKAKAKKQGGANGGS